MGWRLLLLLLLGCWFRNCGVQCDGCRVFVDIVHVGRLAEAVDFVGGSWATANLLSATFTDVSEVLVTLPFENVCRFL